MSTSNSGIELAEPNRLHCFIDRRLAPGYIGWIVAGVGVIQVGLAGRVQAGRLTATEAMAPFLEKIAPIVEFRSAKPVSIRAGMIPCGGVVAPVAARRIMLVGDAAGMVSPVTAGGIHTALKHGLAAGHAIADFLNGKGDDPSESFVRSYPRFRAKRLLRFMFDHFQSDRAFDLLLGTRPMRAAASIVYFHRKGVFRPGRPVVTTLQHVSARLPWLDGLVQDVRYAARTLRKNAGFTIVAVAMLGLGGINALVFTVADAAPLQRLPPRPSKRSPALHNVGARVLCLLSRFRRLAGSGAFS